MLTRRERTPLRKLMLLGAMAGAGALVEDTATGNPLTFITDKAKPLKSLLIPFSPIQSGSGDPSPENIRPILPWNGLKVFGSGQNIITNGFTNGVLDLNTGNKNYNPNYIVSEFIPVVPLKSYYFRCPTVEAYELDICYYDKDKQYLGYIDADGYSSCNTPGISRKTPAGCYYVRIDARNAQYNNDICINYPASVTGYVPAVGITETDIVFPSPVYGGEHEAVSGKLMDGWAVKVFDGSPDELWDKISSGSASAFAMQIQISGKSTSADSYMCDSLKNIARNATWGNYDNWISDNQNSIITGIKAITTVADWRAYLAEHPITVVYKLATPQTVTLTPTQITALVGDNTIWSDADGSMTAVYLKKG